MRRLFAIVVALAGGCEKKAPRYEGPLRVDFGDCATDAAWVSGPRPLPIDKRVASTGKKPDEKKPDPDVQEFGMIGLTGTGAGAIDDTNIYGGLLGTEVGEGGGTGWGTIGTGRYGTIGRGTGTGYALGGGRGGMRGRTSTVPTVGIGQPSAQGDLDKAIIRRYIKRNIAKIQYCYEKALLAKPTLAGTITVHFLISPDGTVQRSTGSGVDPTVSSCVAAVIKNIEFPKPKGDGSVQVSYPFMFRPAEGTARNNVIVGTGSGSAGSAAELPKPEPPKPEPKPKAKGAVEQGPYKPGGNNPLVAQRAAIEDCLRLGAKPYGALVVQLDWSGTNLTKTTVHGGDDGVAECMTDALKQLTRSSTDGASQSCSIAFGTMPAADLPGVDITAESIKYGGVPIASTPAIVSDQVPTFKIEALFVKAEADVKRDAGVTAPVTLVGPLVVRPLDVTPIAVVNKVLNTLLAAGANFVFAANRDGTWQLLKEIAVPVVPVPKGTGGSWTHSVRKRSRMPADEDVRVHLSILVQKDQMWIGLSRVNEFAHFPDANVQKLKDALATHKKSAFFADRTDLEIAGEGVTYGDVVKVIEAAREAGFVEWMLTDPAGLAARPTL